MTKLLAAAGLAFGLALTAVPANAAYFMVDLNPGAEKFYIDDANKDVNHFTGTVGISGPAVTVDTIGNVDTGSGYANIRPAGDNQLTSLIFTPDDSNLFAEFSTRGQLTELGAGTLTITVQDNQGHAAESFVFNGLGGTNDFARLGITAISGGTSILWVKIESNFKEFKQPDFSFASATTVPEPASWSLMILGFGLAAAMVRTRRTVRA